jgi:hypothetical protein
MLWLRDHHVFLGRFVMVRRAHVRVGTGYTSGSENYLTVHGELFTTYELISYHRLLLLGPTCMLKVTANDVRG